MKETRVSQDRGRSTIHDKTHKLIQRLDFELAARAMVILRTPRHRRTAVAAASDRLLELGRLVDAPQPATDGAIPRRTNICAVPAATARCRWRWRVWSGSCCCGRRCCRCARCRRCFSGRNSSLFVANLPPVRGPPPVRLDERRPLAHGHIPLHAGHHEVEALGLVQDDAAAAACAVDVEQGYERKRSEDRDENVEQLLRGSCQR